MDTNKLQSLIAQKNEQLERDALRRASDIIDAIADNQATIEDAQANIVALRKELTAMQIQQINPVSILG